MIPKKYLFIVITAMLSDKIMIDMCCSVKRNYSAWMVWFIYITKQL